MDMTLETTRQTERRHDGEARTGDSLAHPVAHPLLTMQQHAGNQAVQHLLRDGPIQAKLSISQPGDPSEREADQVAERIMRTPDATNAHLAVGPALSQVQRKCSCAESDTECEDCKMKGNASPLRRKTQATPAAKSDVPAVVRDALSAPGEPLGERTRSFMESRLGHDFRNVRVSSDERSARAAEAIQAKAFTLGNRIVFSRNEYSPTTTSGLGLIAHELAHTVQQGSSAPALQTGLQVGAVSDPQEREADLAAAAATGLGRSPSLSPGRTTIRRQLEGTGYTWDWKGDNEGVYTSGSAKYTVTRTSETKTDSVPTDVKAGLKFAKAFVSITWCKGSASGAVEAGVDITNQLQQLIPQILATGNPAQVLRDAKLTPYVKGVVIQSGKRSFHFDIQADVGRQGVSAVRVGGGVETPKGGFDVSGGVSGLGPGEHPFPSGTVTYTPGSPAQDFKCETTTFPVTYKCTKQETTPPRDVPIIVNLPFPPRTHNLYFDFANDNVTSAKNKYGKDHPNIVARNEETFQKVREDLQHGFRISAITGFTSPEGPMGAGKGKFEGNEKLAQERADAAFRVFAEGGLCAIYREEACFTPSKDAVKRVAGGTHGELYTKGEPGQEAEGEDLAKTAVPAFLANEGENLREEERKALAQKRGATAQSDIVYPLLRRAEITLVRSGTNPVTLWTEHLPGGVEWNPVSCPAEVEQAADLQFSLKDPSPK